MMELADVPMSLLMELRNLVFMDDLSEADFERMRDLTVALQVYVSDLFTILQGY